ncbi:MAG: prepilin peptidase [Geminicoccaceae bacterium]
MTSFDLFLWLGVLTLLAVAVWTDLKERRIRNEINLTLAVVFLIAAPVMALTASAGWPDLAGLGWHLVTGAAVLTIGFLLFAFNLVGGGDGKLLAALSLWVGPEGVYPLLALTALFGGVLSVAYLLARWLRPFCEIWLLQMRIWFLALRPACGPGDEPSSATEPTDGADLGAEPGTAATHRGSLPYACAIAPAGAIVLWQFLEH